MSSNGYILFVGFDPTLADLLISILSDEGYQVATAQDSTDALAAIAQQAPELILLDLDYPSWRGMKIVEQVRAHARATMPIVVMTTEPHGSAHAQLRGTSECLAKPFDLYELLDCVARYVQPAQEAWQVAY